MKLIMTEVIDGRNYTEEVTGSRERVADALLDFVLYAVNSGADVIVSGSRQCINVTARIKKGR